MQEITATLFSGLAGRGWHVKQIEVVPVSARIVVTDPATGEACEVDVLKEVLHRPPVLLEPGMVLAVEDVVGTKMRALADRGYARDLIDVHAASQHFARADLEGYGRRVRGGLDPAELRSRLAGAEWIDDDEFEAYGLSEDAIQELRRWAQEWADDLGRRLAGDDPDSS